MPARPSAPPRSACPGVSRRAAALVAAAALALLTACAVQIAGTPTAVPPTTIDGSRLEQEVHDFLAADPSTADLAAAAVQCPKQVPASPEVSLFCQVVLPTRVALIPVTILDRDGNYRIGHPF
jgi:hypothetical protein